jgi:putative DNA-invertase from lambdoid prophage Rac
MRAGLLRRVSTDEQTLENQREPLEQLAAARGWEPVWYDEEAVSGAAKRRPVLELLLADARAGRIRAVGVVALDRLGRSMSGVIAAVTELHRVGCVAVSLREPWLDTSGPHRDLLLAIFAWVAQEERRILIERTRAGLQRARRRGTKSGKAIGRPRASSIMLGAAARLVQQGQSIRQAAAATPGVTATSLRRHLKALAAPQNDEGGPTGTDGVPQD